MAAADELRHTEPAIRADWLEAVAAAVAEASDELVPIAHEETGIPLARLAGEVERTVNQLRLFADVCREGSFLEVIIDHPVPDARPIPSPDVRRFLIPLGPVAVFSASNFPFAFGVAGGDTASALAAGCPVIVKAHPGHPRLSDATAAVVAKALVAAGAPAGAFGLIHGTDNGRALVAAPGITAVGFTGSLEGGRALFDICAARPDPIPFYGELGSLNPVIITATRAISDAPAIATGFVGSLTTSAGQLCTKPGLLLVPAGSGIAEAAAEAAADVPIGRLVSSRIAAGFTNAVARWESVPNVRRLTTSPTVPLERPILVATDVPTLLDHADTLLVEAFGPGAIVVEYGTEGQLNEVVEALPAALAGAIFGTADDPFVPGLARSLERKVGRLIFDGWPTGVWVTWGMHQGGPYPATTSTLHTSVGATSIRRWLRPVAYQNWPQSLLPLVLRDSSRGPRRVDGRLTNFDAPRPAADQRPSTAPPLTPMT